MKDAIDRAAVIYGEKGWLRAGIALVPHTLVLGEFLSRAARSASP